jgi:hypothetical protein
MTFVKDEKLTIALINNKETLIALDGNYQGSYSFKSFSYSAIPYYVTWDSFYCAFSMLSDIKKVYVTYYKDGAAPTTNETTSSIYFVKGLLSDTDYHVSFDIETNSGKHILIPEEIIHTIPFPEVPAAVENTRAIKFSWADAFKAVDSKNATFLVECPQGTVTELNPAGKYKTITGLNPGSSYNIRYKLKYTGGGEGPEWSPWKSITLPASIPVSPLQVTRSDWLTIDVKIPPISGGYTVLRNIIQISYGGPPYVWQDVGAANGGENANAEFRIKVKNADGISLRYYSITTLGDSMPAQGTDIGDTLPKWQGLQPPSMTIGYGYATIKGMTNYGDFAEGDDPINVQGQKFVEYQKVGESTWTREQVPNRLDREYNIIGITGTYNFRYLIKFDTGRESIVSPSVQGTVAAFNNVTISSIASGDKKVTFKWNAVAGASQYEYYYKLGNNPAVSAQRTSDTFFTLTNLTQDKYPIIVYVRPRNIFGGSGTYVAYQLDWAIITDTVFITDYDPNTHVLNVKWTPVIGAFDYTFTFICADGNSGGGNADIEDREFNIQNVDYFSQPVNLRLTTKSIFGDNTTIENWSGITTPPGTLVNLSIVSKRIEAGPLYILRDSMTDYVVSFADYDMVTPPCNISGWDSGPTAGGNRLSGVSIAP